jgi:hypothetical protein
MTFIIAPTDSFQLLLQASPRQSGLFDSPDAVRLRLLTFPYLRPPPLQRASAELLVPERVPEPEQVAVVVKVV